MSNEEAKTIIEAMREFPMLPQTPGESEALKVAIEALNLQIIRKITVADRAWLCPNCGKRLDFNNQRVGRCQCGQALDFTEVAR